MDSRDDRDPRGPEERRNPAERYRPREGPLRPALPPWRSPPTKIGPEQREAHHPLKQGSGLPVFHEPRGDTDRPETQRRQKSASASLGGQCGHLFILRLEL